MGSSHSSEARAGQMAAFFDSRANTSTAKLEENSVGSDEDNEGAEVEEDLRVKDGKALLSLLEDLVLGNRLEEDTVAATSQSSAAVIRQGKHARDMVPCDTVNAGIDTSDARLDSLSISVEGEISRMIVGFLGDSWICRTCGTVRQFYEDRYPCNDCIQHYCKGCFPQAPELCAECETCMCGNVEDWLHCGGSCSATYHAGCGDFSYRFGWPCCANCEPIFVNVYDNEYHEFLTNLYDDDS